MLAPDPVEYFKTTCLVGLEVRVFVEDSSEVLELVDILLLVKGLRVQCLNISPVSLTPLNILFFFLQGQDNEDSTGTRVAMPVPDNKSHCANMV